MVGILVVAGDRWLLPDTSDRDSPFFRMTRRGGEGLGVGFFCPPVNRIVFFSLIVESHLLHFYDAVIGNVYAKGNRLRHAVGIRKVDPVQDAVSLFTLIGNRQGNPGILEDIALGTACLSPFLLSCRLVPRIVLAGCIKVIPVTLHEPADEEALYFREVSLEGIVILQPFPPSTALFLG